MSQKTPTLLNVILRPLDTDKEGLLGAACATLINKNFSGTRLETEHVDRLEIVTLGNERVVKIPIVNINERFESYFRNREYFTPVSFSDSKTIATVIADCNALLITGRAEFCQTAIRICTFWKEFAPTDVFPAVDFTSAGPELTNMFYNSAFWQSSENLVPFRSEHLGYIYELLGDAVSWLAWSGDIERLHRAVILGYSLIQNISQNKADRRVFQAKLSYALRLAMRYTTFLLEKSLETQTETDAGQCYYLRHLTVVAYLLRHAPLLTFEEHQSLVELRGQIDRIIQFTGADIMTPLEAKSELTDLIDPIRTQAPVVAKATEFMGAAIRQIPRRVSRRGDKSNVASMARRLPAAQLRDEFFKLYAHENSVDISILDCVTLYYPKDIVFFSADEKDEQRRTHLETGRRIQPFNFAPTVPVNLNYPGSWSDTTELSEMIDMVWDCSVVRPATVVDTGEEQKRRTTQYTGGSTRLEPVRPPQRRKQTQREQQASKLYGKLPRYEPQTKRNPTKRSTKGTSYASVLTRK